MIRNHTCTLAMLMALGLFASAAHATTIYRQTFGNQTGSAESPNSYNWLMYRTNNAGTGAENLTNMTSGATGITAGAGNPSKFDLPSVNATVVEEGPFGRVFMVKSNPSSGAWAAYTNATETTAINNVYSGLIQDLASFSFDHGNTNDNIDFRALVQVDGNWYVTFDSATNGIGGAGNYTNAVGGAEQVTFALTGGDDWLPLLGFNPGSNMGTLGATAQSLTGSVSAYGLYGRWLSNDATVARFDNFTINALDPQEVPAIPEPTAAALALLGLASLTLRRRR
jgi:hypothetical protein